MKVFFYLCALLALAAAQCSYEGQTFENDAETITFGAAVGDWVPSIIHTKGEDSVIFATSFKAATASRVDVFDWATTATERCATNEVGHFSIAWKADCSEFSFHMVSDSCASRSSALVKSAFTVVEKAEGCLAAGSSLSGNLGESEQQPRLSGDSVTFTVGMDGYVLASVADRAVILERWKYESGQLTTVGIGSYPDGLACDQRYKGRYTAAFGGQCAVTLCGTVDSCQSRAQLYNGVQLNGDDRTCPGAPVPEPDFPESTACSDGRQWKRHPWDCINQGTKGECFFCKGIAHDETISMCLERQGGGCNQIFESQAAGAYCNLEFECPASTLAVSSAFLIVSVVLTAFVGFF